MALNEAERSGICGLALTFTGPDPLCHEIRLACLALPDNCVYVANLLALGNRITGDLIELIENAGIKKVIYDAKTGLSFLYASKKQKLAARNLFDILLASEICWSGYYDLSPSSSPKNPWKKRPADHSLPALAERHLGIMIGDAKESNVKKSDAEDATDIALQEEATAAAVLLPIYRILDELLARNDLQRIADLEFRAIASLAEMEVTGIGLNASDAAGLVRDLEGEIGNLARIMQDEADRTGFVTVKVTHDGRRISCYLNPDRQEDVLAFLRRRGFGVACTKAEVMRGLAAAGCALAEALLRYRHNCYLLAVLNHWMERAHPRDGRVHPHYFQIPSTTGRMSCKDPNAQQIPRAGEGALAVRRLFLPDSGRRFVKGDFSTIELCIMAALSQDRAMLEALQRGADLHRLTASQMSGKKTEEVTAKERRAAKIMNFLLIYGGSASTLQSRVQTDLGIWMSGDEAEAAKESFFRAYPGVRAWHEGQVMAMSYAVPHIFHNCMQGFFALPAACTRTVLGRRRIWPRFGRGLTASRFQMFNTPCQGTGADLIKLVMAEVYEKISSADAKIIGSIHDEILLEVDEKRALEYAGLLKEIMERVGSQLLHPVPVKAEVKIMASLEG
ncbi:MAG: DNA polymerase [Methanothrix sp.]|nr:DNA polymerase [Methanothrix sp.]